MDLWVKICGVRTIEGADAIRAAGADFAGLNFVPSSRRAIDRACARALTKRLGPVTAVGVFRDQDQQEIEAIADEVGLTWIQLHGDETPELCRELSARFSVVKAFNLGRGLDRASLEAYRDHVAAFLFDGPRPGSAQAFDRVVLSALSSIGIDRRYFIAGGLTPTNVAQAIRELGPGGVDVASGIEGETGEQDAFLIQAFVEKARSATR